MHYEAYNSSPSENNMTRSDCERFRGISVDQAILESVVGLGNIDQMSFSIISQIQSLT
jgi:hypothetical protein